MARRMAITATSEHVVAAGKMLLVEPTWRFQDLEQRFGSTVVESVATTRWDLRFLQIKEPVLSGLLDITSTQMSGMEECIPNKTQVHPTKRLISSWSAGVDRSSLSNPHVIDIGGRSLMMAMGLSWSKAQKLNDIQTSLHFMMHLL